MASLFRTIATERRAPVVEDRATLPMTLDDYATMMGSVLDDWQSFNGGITQTWRGEPAERIGTSMSQLAQYAYKGNGLAFACMAVRMMAFSLVRFSWQRMRNGRPGDLFGTPALMPLEMPWTGGTTQDLLQRMLLDVDLAGNSYVTRDGPWLLRLRPDWVQIILEPVVLKGGIVGYRKLGFTFHNGGIEACPPEKVALFGASEVCHFAPLPDSDASYRGMSWLSACVREITNDRTMERHKTKFFENAATPNLSVSLDKAVSADDFAKFKERMDTEHVGTDNAYKTLYLGGGADVKVIGANFDQIKLNDVQGRGETRVAAAAGVPAIIVGLSEGLSSGTYSNYGQAMRRFADLTMASLWGNVSGSLATLLRSPGSDARLWYDTRDVAFLREDRTAAAGIQQIGAATINQYIVSGFEPDSAVAAWTAQDPTLLVHTGLVSVQLQPPGLVAADGKTPIASTDTPAPAASTNAAAQLMLPLGPLDTVDRALGADTGDHPALSTTNGKHL